jgi:hypothetical protein
MSGVFNSVEMAQTAKFAQYPPKWQAILREQGAELTQMPHDWLG